MVTSEDRMTDRLGCGYSGLNISVEYSQRVSLGMLYAICSSEWRRQLASHGSRSDVATVKNLVYTTLRFSTVHISKQLH